MNPAPDPRSSVPDVRVTVRVASGDRAKACGILVRHSAGTALPENRFVISGAAVEALRQAGVQFDEVSRETGSPVTLGVIIGERI